MLGGVAVLLIMIMPIPTILLDLFLAFSFSIALLVLFVSFYLRNPVDFSIFPTILLGTRYSDCLSMWQLRVSFC